MAKIFFHSDQLNFTNGVSEINLTVAHYRECIEKLKELYHELQDENLSSYIVTIDGAVIHSPFLEKLGPDSEIIFIKKINAG
jgi:hypothetical protein